MADFGYDVADYCAIEPVFGTMEDFDALIADVHARGMKLILDFVPNHTSEQHPWFLESRSSRSNPKRDWYIWHDPAPDGGPPNNWVAFFGGSGWKWDEKTGQYYYHAYLREQPDLNWRNPAVRAAMFNVMRFWLDRGVDGFRVDVMWHLIKDAEFRDNPSNPDYREGLPEVASLIAFYSTDRPEVHEVVREMRAVVDEYDERLLIGEIYLPIDRLVTYYGEHLDEAQLPFNFQLVEDGWDAEEVWNSLNDYEAALPKGGWPNWVLGNHDKPRVATRVGRPQARVAMLLLLTARGTPTLYYGDEIAMENVAIPEHRAQDPWQTSEPGDFGRDPQRTPMQWEAGPGAGFTTGAPWLPIAPDAAEYCVARESRDPASMLSLTWRLIELRRAHPALSVGRYAALGRDGDVIAYLREHESERFAVVLNLGAEQRRFTLPDGVAGAIALSTLDGREGEAAGGTIDLRGNEGLLIRLG
jgi:alpha-glucosidase